MPADEPITRREFLRQLARYAAGGLLTLGTWSLIARPGKACGLPQACASCNELARCDRPEARNARRTQPVSSDTRSTP